MEINGGHPNEKKNIQSLPRKGFGHHRLHLVDIQRQAEEWEASLSSLAQSGAESTIPGWEACPQLRRGGALPPQEAYFTHVLVK